VVHVRKAIAHKVNALIKTAARVRRGIARKLIVRRSRTVARARKAIVHKATVRPIKTGVRAHRETVRKAIARHFRIGVRGLKATGQTRIAVRAHRVIVRKRVLVRRSANGLKVCHLTIDDDHPGIKKCRAKALQFL